MKEAMVVFGNGGYVYFDTKASNAKVAAEELLCCMEMLGFNVDNLRPTKSVLRNSDIEDVDEVNFADS